MRHIVKTLMALAVAFAVVLGFTAAPASAATNYQAKTCYKGSLRFQVTSWNNSSTSKTYHWSASQITPSYPWAYATIGGVKRTAREGTLTVSSTANRWAYGHWKVGTSASVIYCGVYL